MVEIYFNAQSDNATLTDGMFAAMPVPKGKISLLTI